MRDRVLRYVRDHQLLHAGDRVGVAVSGGSDSVALLRLLLELRQELGVVLGVVHFHHGIRGADADSDADFVADLAAQHQLELHRRDADVPGAAKARKASLETAARELRYDFFRELLKAGSLDSIATGHTADDQAETVLMRFLRGSGTRGLAGIWPSLAIQDSGPRTSIVRPLLGLRRDELRTYLHQLSQDWREDASNLDPTHTRNRLRGELLPLLGRDYNPAIVRVLNETANVARAEEQYWSHLAAEFLTHPDRLDLDRLNQLDLAVRRRVIRAAAVRVGLKLEFEHVEAILALDPGRRYQLRGFTIERAGNELRLHRAAASPQGFEAALSVPGEARIPQLEITVRAQFANVSADDPGYTQPRILPRQELEQPLLVRNWRPGDRFLPPHTRSEKKVKELLQEMRVTGPQRALWPVVATSTGRLLWVSGCEFPEWQVADRGRLVITAEQHRGAE